MPHERSLVERYQGRPFALLGINTDEDRESLPAKIQKEQINWRSWWDASTTGPITTKWNVRAFPSYYVLDHRGIIRYSNVYGKALDEAIDTLLQEAE
jgi:hypothetical protein